VRSARLATLESATRHHLPLPVDDPVVEQFARLVSFLTPAGKNPRVMDTLIAATALTHGAVVVSQDDDFEGLPGVSVLKV
jgi:predicted nucleic acid-binding protein